MLQALGRNGEVMGEAEVDNLATEIVIPIRTAGYVKSLQVGDLILGVSKIVGEGETLRVVTLSVPK